MTSAGPERGGWKRKIRALATPLRPDGGSTSYFECRHCGTAVEGREEPCTNCGSDEIASYEL